MTRLPPKARGLLIGTLTAGTTVLAAAALKAANRISTPQDVILVAATGDLLASVVALVGTRSSVSASPRPAEIGSSP
jgi:fructose-specific component phosphotransferase system IIB-like protein